MVTNLKQTITGGRCKWHIIPKKYMKESKDTQSVK